MSRRADPENVYLARGSAVLSIPAAAGVRAGRAEELSVSGAAPAPALRVDREDRFPGCRAIAAPRPLCHHERRGFRPYTQGDVRWRQACPRVRRKWR